MSREEAKAKILIVDDEQGIRDLLCFELGSKGFDVKTASNGEEGVNRVRQEKFDLALMDIKMPKMDGITALARMKEIEPEMDVIIATGYGTIETAIESMKKGACDYIGKPFNIDEVIILIEHALEQRKLRETVALYEVSKALFTTIKLEDLLEIVIHSIPKVLRADDGSLMLLDNAGKAIMASSFGLHGSAEENARVALGNRILRIMAENREQTLLINDIGRELPFEGIKGLENIHSSMALPLRGRKKLLGLLLINRTKISENFTAGDIRKANLFISLVVMAIENANLYKELQVAQSQLVQSEKMNALGQLAGGAAHELNNPLTAILGNAQILLAEIPRDNPLRVDLITIEEATQRCKKIINNLLGFARQCEFPVQSADINDVIDRTLDLCSHQVELKKVKIVKQFAKHLPPVNINPTEMLQVFLNIILNAQHAMPQGGALCISTQQKDGTVEISFRDEGVGISGENLSKVFDPFFTTKEVGQGTGLGLSVSLGIVQKHAGTIRAESAGVGKGAVFIVALPVGH